MCTRKVYVFLLLGLQVAFADQQPITRPVTIRVNASRTLATFKPIWSFFGYDEANYTYSKNGRKLIGELAESSPVPVFFRAHNLLTTGDGTPALKWGSTNAFAEDAAGNTVYDWTLVDRIFDTYIQANAKPFVEIGFMPEALSAQPEPYRHHWPSGRLDTGWAYPPKDYARWGELVSRWVSHAVARYGKSEVESWYWEVWNEPDILYWHGSPEDYNRLYDYSVRAVKGVLPGTRVGGPATTGPAGKGGADFLRQFLKHCQDGRNHATGGVGAPLDFISYHAKGHPGLRDGVVRMGIDRHLQDVEQGLEIIEDFPGYRRLPVILSESDPEGCAACPAKTHPQNAYRNGPLYPAYTALVLNSILKLGDLHNANIEGMLTWAFEFEDQPFFAGFRTLATNGIDKPILNLFRMLGLISGKRVSLESTGSVPLEAIVHDGVRGLSDVDALAVVGGHALSILAWNYQDDDASSPAARIALEVAGLAMPASSVLLHHYRIDDNHSNSYRLWKELGSPQNPTPEVFSRVEEAGQLQLLESPRWIRCDGGKLTLDFTLPLQGVSLLQFTW